VSTRVTLAVGVLALVLGFAWLGRGGRESEQVADEAVDAAVERVPGIPQKCARDLDCSGDALCACRGPNCSITPDFQTTNGLNANYCWSLSARLAAELPIRVDGGWIVEAFPDAGPFGSPAEAMSALLPQRPL